jgi:hypothetical protein
MAEQLTLLPRFRVGDVVTIPFYPEDLHATLRNGDVVLVSPNSLEVVDVAGNEPTARTLVNDQGLVGIVVGEGPEVEELQRALDWERAIYVDCFGG